MRLLKRLRTWRSLRRYVHGSWSLIRSRRVPLAAPTCQVRFKDGGVMTLRGPTNDRRILIQVFGRDEYRLDELGDGGAECIIDVGAHVGIFATRAAPLAKRVLSFEPTPASFDLLVANVRRFPGVVPVRKAVSDRRGAATLRLEPEPSANALLLGNDDGGPGTIRVDAVTLADVFADHSVQRCALLKLDCEGAEYPIVYGLTDDLLRRIDRFAMEYHPVEGADPSWSGTGMAAWLGQKGYAVDLRPQRNHPGKGLLFAVRRPGAG